MAVGNPHTHTHSGNTGNSDNPLLNQNDINTTTTNHNAQKKKKGYIVTGRAAHGRIARLFQGLLEEHYYFQNQHQHHHQQALVLGEEVGDEQEDDNCTNINNNDDNTAAKEWVDLSPYANNNNNESANETTTTATTTTTTSTTINNNNNTNNGQHQHEHPNIAFLWENAPRLETKGIRNTVACYSHLPNGILLDDKWALARLLGWPKPKQHRHSDQAGDVGHGGGAIKGAPRRRGHDDDDDDANLNLATLDSHCFRGADFATFARRVGLLAFSDTNGNKNSLETPSFVGGGGHEEDEDERMKNKGYRYQYEDLLLPTTTSSSSSSNQATTTSLPPPMPSNLWVIKDSMSNGAGGIWIVDESNADDFIMPNNTKEGNCGEDIDDTVNIITNTTHQGNNAREMNKTIPQKSEAEGSSSSSTSCILHPTHRYIAQQYAWPPTLYGGRKCHVRVYAAITSNGKAYVHRRAFLHVANAPFDDDDDDDDDDYCNRNDEQGGAGEEGGKGEKGKKKKVFEPSVHITNCCANSHDATKFAGEICADLELPGPLLSPRAMASAAATADEQSHLGGIQDGDGNSSSSAAADIMPLGDYLPSISASIRALAQKFEPYIRGGEMNNGFEYLGLDFVLSSVAEEGAGTDQEEDGVTRQQQCRGRRRRPVAYLLEVNAPPSQDTATGLPHAEKLHDDVISDLLRMWALPNVLGVKPCEMKTNRGGWRCVYTHPTSAANDNGSKSMADLIVPSKAAILNKIRWAIFEKRAIREYESMWQANDTQKANGYTTQQKSSAKPGNNEDGSGGLSTKEIEEGEANQIDDCSCESKQHKSDRLFDPDAFVTFVRSQFPYFSTNQLPLPSSSKGGNHATEGTGEIFFESGGGAQVPKVVCDEMMASLYRRDRSMAGAACQRMARAALASLLIGDGNDTGKEGEHADQCSNYLPIMGPNATSLLERLAQKLSSQIIPGDEIVIATENHLANVTPWLTMAREVGAKIRLWTVTKNSNQSANDSSCILSDLINNKTKIVAVSHVSNILGQERDIQSICTLVHSVTENRAQVVVDGVAAAPHLLSTGLAQNVVPSSSPDWYVVSLHKMFGPHLGCLVGRRSFMVQLYNQKINTAQTNDIPSNEQLCKSWELGTMNYEGCSGAIGLKKYFDVIANYYCGVMQLHDEDVAHQYSHQITSESRHNRTAFGRSSSIALARICIQQTENRLLDHLLDFFQNRCPSVRIVQDVGEMKVLGNSNGGHLQRIPIVSFIHATISSCDMVQHCRNYGISCRSCKFLSTERLLDELHIKENIVRLSLAHYNSLNEIIECIRVLEMLEGWSG